MDTILITGANRGIGLELARELSKTYQVIAVCRKASPALTSLPHTTIIEDIELSDPHSIRAVLARLNTPLCMLINNAGILEQQSLDAVVSDSAIASLTSQWQVNALAPLLVTQSCRHLLQPNSKVILITSRMGSIQDNHSGSHYGYRMSKAALNAAGKSLAIDLKPEQIAVGILHPGWVKTAMTDHTGHTTASDAAKQLIRQIHRVDLNNSGTFWHANGDRLPW